MKREELKTKLLNLIIGIAPDVDAAAVLPGVPLRDQFDFDYRDSTRAWRGRARGGLLQAREPGLGCRLSHRETRRLSTTAESARPVCCD